MGKLKGYKEKTFYMKPAVSRELAKQAKKARRPQYEVVEDALVKHLNMPVKEK